jgi:hypothetical protein
MFILTFISALSATFFDLGRLCIYKPGPNHSFTRVRGRTTYLLSPIIGSRSKTTYIYVVGVFARVDVGCMLGTLKTIDGALCVAFIE